LALGPILTAGASSAAVSLNLASGGATPLDWTSTLDLNHDGAFGDVLMVATGPATSVTINFTPATLTSVSGDLTSLTIADGLVTGSAHFEIGKRLAGVHLASGDLTDAILLTLGLSALDLHVGTGGISFEVAGGTVALASLQAPAPSGPATDTRQWVAFKGSLESVTFHGVTGLTLDVSALSVSINTSSGSVDDQAGHSGDASALDWTTSLNLNGDVTFGDPVVSDSDHGDQLDVGGTLIDFTGALVAVSGTARVSIADLVTGETTF